MNNTATNNISASPVTDLIQQVNVSMPELIGILANRRGSAFASFEATYDMLETDDKGALKRMKKADVRGKAGKPNPWLAHGKKLIKHATTHVMVTFDYDKRLKKVTDAKESAKDGNWQQAVIINGKLSPLTIHKGDILTKPKNGAKPQKDGKYKYEDLQAVYDNANNLIYTASPEKRRFYLRCEYKSSESHYIDETGATIAPEMVKPWLKSSSRGAIDFHSVSMANIWRVKIDKTIYIIK